LQKQSIIKYFNHKNFNRPVIAFFALYLVIGLLIHRDYGVTWDESVQREHGKASWDAINDHFDGFFYDKPYFEGEDRKIRSRYGMLFQMVALQLERTFNIRGIREPFLLRHLLGFLLFFTATIFFYKIISQRTRSWKWGLIGALFLILSPRIFAHAFFNPKDAITFSLYLIATYSLLQFVEKRSLKTALTHGFATGILLNARLVGLGIPVLTFGVLFWELIVIRSINKYFPKTKIIGNNLSFNDNPIKSWVMSGVYLVATGFFTFIFWPYLWSNPFGKGVGTLKAFTKYSAWDGQILYWGEYVRSANLPWHYVPSYMLTTIPLAFGPLFFIGLYFILKKVAQSKGWLYQSKEGRTDLILLAIFIAPLIAVIALNANMYDGWRHTFFIYVGFLGIATLGFYHIWQRRTVKKWIWQVALVLVSLNMVDVTYWMIRYHPLQNAYFNLYAGKNIIYRMEVDYWGQGYRQLYEILAELDPSEKIRVQASSYPGWENFRTLEPELKKRFVYNWEKKSGGYYLTNYRFEEELNNWKNNTSFYKDPVHIVYIRRTPVLGIYCLEDHYD